MYLLLNWGQGALHSALEGNCKTDVAPSENEFDIPISKPELLLLFW